MSLPDSSTTARILATALVRNKVTSEEATRETNPSADYWTTHKIAAIRHIRETMHSMGYHHSDSSLMIVKDALEDTIRVEAALATLRATVAAPIHESYVRQALATA